jgi:membrane-associated protease RseP (regulator of RpoE activity)
MFTPNSLRHAAFAVFLMIAALTACVSSHILVGTVRPAISPAQVQVYLRPPAKFEEVAILNTSSKNSLNLTAQGRTDVVIERLKEEAAKLGANGVLIQSIGDQAVGAIGASGATVRASPRSASILALAGSVTLSVKTGDAIAIYVDANQVPDVVPSDASPAASVSTGSRATLGIRMIPTAARAMGIEGADGATVTAVAPHSAAAQAGIKEGDILLRVEDTDVNDPDDVQTAVAALAPGSTVAIRLMRKARVIWVYVQF